MMTHASRRIVSTGLAALGFALAGCSGAGQTGLMQPPVPTSVPIHQPAADSKKLGTITITIAKSKRRASAKGKRPSYISPAAQSLYVVFEPLDPVAKARFPKKATSCTNLGGSGSGASVTLQVPAGPNYFSIAQYSGGCSRGALATPDGSLVAQFTYGASEPTPLAALAGDAGLRLPPTNPPIVIVAGVANDLNALLWNAYTDSPAGTPVPTFGAPPLATAFTATLAGPAQQPVSAAAAAYIATQFDLPYGGSESTYPAFSLSVLLAGVQVTANDMEPMIELAPFVSAGYNELIPLNVSPFDASGNPIVAQGQTAVPIALGTTVTLTTSESTNVPVVAGARPTPHEKLYLVDNTAGAILQSGNTVKFDQVATLDAATLAASSCPSGCAPGDSIAFYLTYDGSPQTMLNSMTVTPSYSATAATLPKTIFDSTGPITPQRTVISTANIDPAVLPNVTAYTTPLGLATDGAGNLYVADGGQIKADYRATASPAVPATTFSGLTYDPDAKYVFAVNNAATSGGTAIYGYATPALANGGPLVVANPPAGFTAPQGIAYDAITHDLYVLANDTVFQVVIGRLPTSGAAGTATATIIAGRGQRGDLDGPGVTALFAFGSNPFVGIVADTTGYGTSGDLYIADTANNVIRVVDPRTTTVTTLPATIAGVTGLAFGPIGATSVLLATGSAGLSAIAPGALTATNALLPAGPAPAIDGFAGAAEPFGQISTPVNEGLQFGGSWPGQVPVPAVLGIMGATTPDSMTNAQNNGLFASSAVTVAPQAILYARGSAGTFPDGAYIFTEGSLLRGLL